MKKVISIAALLVCSEVSMAMQCIPEDVEDYYAAADFVFEATVVDRVKIAEESNGICWTEGDKCGAKIATVKVGNAWKGEFKTNETSIYSEDGCYCLGTYFNIGEKYLVFGNRSGEKEYEIRDMAGCATELFKNVEPKSLEKLGKLKSEQEAKMP